jgi:hypothetical protein
MTTEPEISDASALDEKPLSVEETLRRRVSMLMQLLGVAVVVVLLQFGIMIKVLLER